MKEELQRPTVAEQIAAHDADRDRLAEVLRAHPLEELDQDWLSEETGIPGGSLRTRRGECEHDLGMHIEKIPRFGIVNGKRRRLKEGWRYVPYSFLGRDAAMPTQQKSLFG